MVQTQLLEVEPIRENMHEMFLILSKYIYRKSTAFSVNLKNSEMFWNKKLL